MSEQGLQYPQCVPCSAIRITREEGFSVNRTLLTKGQVIPKQHHLLEFTSALCFLLQSRRRFKKKSLLWDSISLSKGLASNRHFHMRRKPGKVAHICNVSTQRWRETGNTEWDPDSLKNPSTTKQNGGGSGSGASQRTVNLILPRRKHT